MITVAGPWGKSVARRGFLSFIGLRGSSCMHPLNTCALHVLIRTLIRAISCAHRDELPHAPVLRSSRNLYVLTLALDLPQRHVVRCETPV